jgi:hypothetical protein
LTGIVQFSIITSTTTQQLIKEKLMTTVHETANFVVIATESNGFELHRKIRGRTMFLKRSKFQTALIVALNSLEK